MAEFLGSIGRVGFLRVRIFSSNVNDLLGDGSTLIFHAASGGHVESLEFLLSLSPDLSITNSSGYDALAYAVYGKHLTSAEILINAGAKVSNEHVRISVLTGDSSMFELMIDNGGEVREGNLVFALENGFVEILKVMRERLDLSLFDWESHLHLLTKPVRMVLTDEEFYPTQTLDDKYTLYDYQENALEMMRSIESRKRDPDDYGVSGLLLMFEMGLGKTLTALAFILGQQSANKETFPSIVVCPKSVLYEWKDKGVDKFFPGTKALYYHKDIDPTCLTKTSDEIRDHQIVLTTYDMINQIMKGAPQEVLNSYVTYGDAPVGTKQIVLQIDKRVAPPYNPTLVGHAAMRNMSWVRIFADECQRHANPKTKLFMNMLGMCVRFSYGLSGTPIRNYDLDIWSLFRFLGYTGNTRPKGWNQGKFREHDLGRFIVTETYESVGVKLPDKVMHEYIIPMDPYQARLYTSFLKMMDSMFKDVADAVGGMMMILSVFTRLRQTCIAPYVIVAPKRRASKDDDTSEFMMKLLDELDTPVADWLRDPYGTAGIYSPKILQIMEVIRSIPSGEKILIFSMFSSILDLVELAIKTFFPSIKSIFVDGSVSGKRRASEFARFMNDPEVTVAVLNMKAAGEGVNLTAAKHVLLIEPWWTGAVHDQAISRALRRGQTSDSVHVHWVLTSGTIEPEILKMCDYKKSLADSYLKGTPLSRKSFSLGKHDMRMMLDKALAQHSIVT